MVGADMAPSKRDLPFLAVFGVFGLAAVHFTYFKTLSLTGVATAILLEYLAPILVLVFSVVFLRERPSWRLPAGVLLSVAGCALMVGVFGGAMKVSQAGIAWGLASAFFFAFYTLMGKYAAGRYAPWTLLAYGLVAATIFWLLYLGPGRVIAVYGDPRSFGAVVFVAVVSTIIPFGAFLHGLQHIQATEASVTSTLEPAVAGVGAFFLFGETRVSPAMHWLAAVMVALGAVVSGFFIVATDAWMQHPVAYAIVDGNAQLTSLWGLLTNPYALWQYPHTISGSMITASMVMAGVGAFYLLTRRHQELGRLSVRVGVVSGLIFSLISLFPTGSLHGENIARYQPEKMAAMEGVFESQEGAPMAIIGMPDTEKRQLLDPILVPRMLSYLAYGDFRARVLGLNDIPEDRKPPVELVYYAYHIMVGLGTIFIAVLAIAALLLAYPTWRAYDTYPALDRSQNDRSHLDRFRPRGLGLS